MEQPVNSLAVAKIVRHGDELVCLLNSVSDNHQSVIKKITFRESFSQQNTLLSLAALVTDIAISSTGTIWLVDALGGLQEVKYIGEAGLGGEVGSYKRYSLDRYIETRELVTPERVIGNDSDLWIATNEGLLIHFDGSCFTTHSGIKNPSKLKSINGRCFLFSCAGEVMEIINGQLENVLIGEPSVTNIPISDLTICNENIIAVSRLGYILIGVDRGPFTVLHSSKDISWYGCDTLNGAVYLAGGQHGAYAISKGELIQIKEKGFMVSVAAVGNAIVYVCAENNKRGVVRYTPLDSDRWALVQTGS